MAMYSWYARAYGVFEYQTLRLNNFMEEFDIVNATIIWNEVKILKNYFFNWKKKLKRFLKKQD
jgi:hypothetical protein